MGESILERTPPAADRRVAYGGAPEQFAELRLPAGTGPFPCVAFIHGGFWRARYDLTHAGHLCAALAHADIATWNVEYRRIGNDGGGWPGTFQDVAEAVRHLLHNAAALGIDPEQVVVMGHSAGGHLAAWLASLANVPAGSEIAGEPLPLRAAVSLAGVVDLALAWELRLSGGVVAELLGGPPEGRPERYAAASPVALVPPPVPVTLVHGAADEIVPLELSRRYRDAAVATGGEANLLSLPHADHFAVIDPASAAWPEIAATVRALLTHGGEAIASPKRRGPVPPGFSARPRR